MVPLNFRVGAKPNYQQCWFKDDQVEFDHGLSADPHEAAKELFEILEGYTQANYINGLVCRETGKQVRIFELAHYADEDEFWRSRNERWANFLSTPAATDPHAYVPVARLPQQKALIEVGASDNDALRTFCEAEGLPVPACDAGWFAFHFASVLWGQTDARLVDETAAQFAGAHIYVNLDGYTADGESLHASELANYRGLLPRLLAALNISVIRTFDIFALEAGKPHFDCNGTHKWQPDLTIAPRFADSLTTFGQTESGFWRCLDMLGKSASMASGFPTGAEIPPSPSAYAFVRDWERMSSNSHLGSQAEEKSRIRRAFALAQAREANARALYATMAAKRYIAGSAGEEKMREALELYDSAAAQTAAQTGACSEEVVEAMLKWRSKSFRPTVIQNGEED